jgi:hypothetical protein
LCCGYDRDRDPIGCSGGVSCFLTRPGRTRHQGPSVASARRAGTRAAGRREGVAPQAGASSSASRPWTDPCRRQCSRSRSCRIRSTMPSGTASPRGRARGHPMCCGTSGHAVMPMAALSLGDALDRDRVVSAARCHAAMRMAARGRIVVVVSEEPSAKRPCPCPLGPARATGNPVLRSPPHRLYDRRSSKESRGTRQTDDRRSSPTPLRGAGRGCPGGGQRDAPNR